jgi:hypothetical protein
VSAKEIADKLRVNSRRWSCDYQILKKALARLEKVRFSPVITARIPLDNAVKYDFEYDTGPESTRYELYGPFDTDVQDKLVRWMIDLRSIMPSLVGEMRKGNGG